MKNPEIVQIRQVLEHAARAPRCQNGDMRAWKLLSQSLDGGHGKQGVTDRADLQDKDPPYFRLYDLHLIIAQQDLSPAGRRGRVGRRLRFQSRWGHVTAVTR